MMLDTSRSSSPGRRVAIASLPILVATVLGAAAAAPAACAVAPHPVQVAPVEAVGLDAWSGMMLADEYSFQHHLGDGRSLRARVVGHVLFDEKAAGTAHVAIGRNTGPYGGDNDAAIHVDCVFSAPRLTADGVPVLLPAG